MLLAVFPLIVLHGQFILAHRLAEKSIANAATKRGKRSFGVMSSGNLESGSFNWPFPLALENSSDQVPDDVGSPIMDTHTPRPLKTGRILKGNWLPKVSVLGDNLAVNLTWPSGHTVLKPVSHYRIEFRYRDPRVSRWSRPRTVGSEQVDGRVSEPFFYVTNKQPGGLEAGLIYQFRVLVQFKNGDLEKSAWSANTSFAYITPVPPLVKVAQRLPNGNVLIKWTISQLRIGFPIDHFILLFRKEKRLVNGETGYSGFQYAAVRGDLEEYQVTGLDSSTGYQFVVYGVHTPPGVSQADAFFTGGLHKRRITAFSQEVFVPADPSNVMLSQPSRDGGTKISSSSSLLDMNSVSSNSLMFVIFGVLAGFMLLVMLSLVAICFCRQRREKLRLLAQVNASLLKVEPTAVTDDGMDNQHLSPADKVASHAQRCHHQQTVEEVNKEDLHEIRQNHQQHMGFLLSELTPLAVANFRTAAMSPSPLTSAVSPSSGPEEESRPITGTESKVAVSLYRRTNGNSGGHQVRRIVRPLALEHSPRQPPKFLPAFSSTGPFRIFTFNADVSATTMKSDDVSLGSASSNQVNPSEMKREPPSGGSIHDETDNDEEASSCSSDLAAKGTTTTATFNQLPIALTSRYSIPVFGGHSVRTSLFHSTCGAHVGKRFSPGSRYPHEYLPSPLLVENAHGHSLFCGSKPPRLTAEDVNRQVLFPSSVHAGPRQHQRRSPLQSRGGHLYPRLHPACLTASNLPSPLRIQAIVPHGATPSHLLLPSTSPVINSDETSSCLTSQKCTNDHKISRNTPDEGYLKGSYTISQALGVVEEPLLTSENTSMRLSPQRSSCPSETSDQTTTTPARFVFFPDQADAATQTGGIYAEQVDSSSCLNRTVDGDVSESECYSAMRTLPIYEG